jgi:hypothetical protein
VPPVLLAIAAVVVDAAVTSAVTGAVVFGVTIGAIAAGVIGSIAAFGIMAIGQQVFGIGVPSTNRTLSIRDPVMSHKVILGQMKIGGAITFIDCSSDNQTLFMVVTISGHQLFSVDSLYVNDTYVPLNSSGQATEPAIWPDGTKPTDYTNHVQGLFGTGTVAGDAAMLSALVTADTKWGTNFFQYSRGKVYIRLGWNQNLFGATGVPNIAVVARGRMVYDPRNTGTAIVSSSAASPGVFSTGSNAHGLAVGNMVFIKDHSGAVPASPAPSWPQAQSDTVAQEYEVSTVPDAYSFTLLGPDSQPLALADGGTGGTVTRMLWSDNAALALNDYLVEPYHGMGAIYDAEVNESLLISNANLCDEIVPRIALSTTFSGDASLNQIDYVVNNSTGPLPPLCQVIVSNTGGALPGGLSASTPYFYAQTGAGPSGVLCTTSAHAAAKPPVGVTITSTGTGTNTITIVESLEPNPTGTATNPDTFNVYDNSLRLTTGTQVKLSNIGGSPPSPFDTSTDYYAIFLSDTLIQLAASLADARANNFITFTTSGTGTTFITALGEPRYTTNGAIDTEESRQDVIQKILSSMGGWLVPSGVSLNAYPAQYLTPNVTLSESDLRGPISVVALQSGSQSFNSVKGTFVDPFNRGQPTDFPFLQNLTYIQQDNGEIVWKDLTLPFTNSSSTAQRLAKIELERVRRELTVTMPLKLTAFQVGSPDVISVNNTMWGWSGETFEVSNWAFSIGKSEDDKPTLDCDITGRQTDSAVFAWTAAEEAAENRQSNSNLPNPFVVAPPSSLTLASGGSLIVQQPDGTLVSRIEVSWTSPVDEFVLSGGFIEIWYQVHGSGNWQAATPVSGDATIGFIEDAAIGTAYDIAVRSRNAIGALSDQGSHPWQTEIDNYTVLGKTNAPSDISSITVSINGMTVTLSGSPITNTDLRAYEYRYGASASWSGMTVLAQVQAVPNGSGGFAGALTTGNVPNGTWYFGAKALNTSGIYSVNAAFSTAKTITNTINGNTNIAAGTITALQFAAGIQPVLILTGAPPGTSGTYQGELAVSTTDNQLYRWTGSAWTVAVPAVNVTGTLTAAQIASITAAQITGQITTTQITNNAITTPLLASAAVQSANIAAGTIVASNIASGTIIGTNIAGGTITGSLIAGNTIEAANMDVNSVVAGTIAVGAVNATAIVVNDILVTGHLVDNAVTSPNYATAGSQTINNSVLAKLVGLTYSTNPDGVGSVEISVSDYFDRSSGHSPTGNYQIVIDGSSVFTSLQGGAGVTFYTPVSFFYLATGLSVGASHTFELWAGVFGGDPSCTSNAATIRVTELSK